MTDTRPDELSSGVAAAPADTLRMARLGLVLLVVLYVGGHLAWYGATPMGDFPVLDGREMVAMAMAIAEGTLASEPFYCAPLYPALLALPAWLGLPEAAVPDLARLINLLAHIASTLMVFELARRIWQALAAGLLAGALYALYPVAAHFAGDPLDITVATALALAATLAAWVAVERKRPALAAWAGVLVALAALARPNLLICLPALLPWLWWAGGKRQALRLLAGSALVLGAMGATNLAVGGEFRILPWQGSHALWDGNGAGANGLFYQHSGALPELVPGSNPARAEAEASFCAQADCSSGIDIDAFSAYWRERTLTHIAAHPGEWLALMAKKAWYVVNNYEQYNNKTYWLHKERSPWLRLNPLCFALLLAMAAGAMWLPQSTRARSLLGLLLLAYTAGLLLYFVSARFRVPMVGWLAVLAGGWAIALPWLRACRGSRRWKRVAGAVGLASVTGLVSAWPVPEHLRMGTIGEDHALLASAALAANRPSEAEGWAEAVLARDPGRSLAHALVCSARFVAWEQSTSPALPDREWLETSLAHCGAGIPASDRARYNAGFFLLALCRRSDAVEEFEALHSSRLIGPEARSALAVLQHQPPENGEPPAGLLALIDAEGLRPGLRSIVDAALGRHCEQNTGVESPGAQDEH